MRIDANALTHNLMSAADVRSAARAAARGQKQNATAPPSVEPPTASLSNAAPASPGVRPLRPSSNAHGPANAPPPIGLSPNESEGPAPNPAANPASELRPARGHNDQQRPDRVQALLNAWGQADSRFDLNDDGTVNGFDLAHLLAKMSGESSDEVTASQFTPPGADLSETALDTSILASNPPADADSAALIDLPAAAPATPSDPKVIGLLSKWGSDDATFDLNGDGVVNGFDLAMRLSEATGPVTETVDEAAAVLASDDPAAMAPVALVDKPPATPIPTINDPAIGSAAPAKAPEGAARSDEPTRQLNLAALAERMLASLAPEEGDDEPRAQRATSRESRSGSETAAPRERQDVAQQPDLAQSTNDAALQTLRAALDRLQLAGHEQQRALQDLLGEARNRAKIHPIG